MIRKFLLWIFVFCFVFIWFFVDWTYTQNMNVRGAWSYVDSPFDDSVDVAVYSRWMLWSNQIWYTKRMFVYTNKTKDKAFAFWNNNKMYFYYYFYGDNILMQWYTTSYSICDPFSLWDTTVNNCQVNSITDSSLLIINNFMNSFTSSDLYWVSKWYYTVYGRIYYLTMCFNSSEYDKSICFSSSDWLNWSLNFSENLSFTEVWNDLLQDPPWWNTSWWWSQPDWLLTWWWIEVWSDYSAINYYEKTYWWDKSICYAWVSTLDYLYWQNGVSFHEWLWLSVFDVFSWVYWNTDLDKVAVWLNTQLFNYENWFDTNWRIWSVWNPSWLWTYNSWTNQIDLYYDNLTFPFANKPVAFYFLADNIESHSLYSTMWSSIVSYCNIKINSWSYWEIIDQSDKNNITNYTEQSNTNQALNPDWSQKDYTWYWVWSWVDLAFSWNVSIKNTLKNFFDEFDKWLSVIDINTNNRILPTWIVSAFIFVVLFKFLRKK